MLLYLELRGGLPAGSDLPSSWWGWNALPLATRASIGSMDLRWISMLLLASQVRDPLVSITLPARSWLFQLLSLHSLDFQLGLS